MKRIYISPTSTLLRLHQESLLDGGSVTTQTGTSGGTITQGTGNGTENGGFIDGDSKETTLAGSVWDD